MGSHSTRLLVDWNLVEMVWGTCLARNPSLLQRCVGLGFDPVLLDIAVLVVGTVRDPLGVWISHVDQGRHGTCNFPWWPTAVVAAWFLPSVVVLADLDHHLHRPKD